MPSQSPPPPRERARSRSPRPASPPRGPRNRGGGGGGGFRWKEKRRDDNSDRDRGDDRGLQRGYRHERSPRRDYRDRGGRDQNQYNPRRGDDTYRPGEGDRRNPGQDRDRGRDRNRSRERNRDTRDNRQDRDLDVDNKFGRGGLRREERGANSKKEDDKSAPASEKPKAPPAKSGEPLMVVTVNDRLGTKAQITCLASDSVKLFKALVAAKIGRQPHEIMLKRQGERPFKDMLTLADYSVSNGVQLDLELDTGD